MLDKKWVVVIGLVIFLLPVGARAHDLCCQNQGGGCLDGVDVCGSDQESVSPATCNQSKGICELIKKADTKTSSKSSSAGSSKASAPAPSASAPYKAPPGAPSNPGEAVGTPLPGKSLYLPACVYSEGKNPGGCRDVGAFVALFINFANAAFGIIGAVALLFFIYGGITLLTSAGSPEQVKKGKDILVGAVIGILIAFGASLLVRFVVGGLTQQQDTLSVKIGDTTNKSP